MYKLMFFVCVGHIRCFAQGVFVGNWITFRLQLCHRFGLQLLCDLHARHSCLTI